MERCRWKVTIRPERRPMNYVGALICATAAVATLYGTRGGARRRIYTADGLYLYPAPQNASYFDQIQNGRIFERNKTENRCEAGIVVLLLTHSETTGIFMMQMYIHGIGYYEINHNNKFNFGIRTIKNFRKMYSNLWWPFQFITDCCQIKSTSFVLNRYGRHKLQYTLFHYWADWKDCSTNLCRWWETQLLCFICLSFQAV